MKRIFYVFVTIAIAASCAFADGVSNWIDPRSYDPQWIETSAASVIAYLGYHGNEATVDSDGTVTFENSQQTLIFYNDPETGFSMATNWDDVPANATDIEDYSFGTAGRLQSAVAQGSWLVDANAPVGSPIDVRLQVTGLSDEGKDDLTDMVNLNAADGIQRSDNYIAYLYDTDHRWMQWVGAMSFDGENFLMRGEVNNALLRAGEIGYIEFLIPTEGEVVAYDSTNDRIYMANIGSTPGQIKLGEVTVTTVPEPATYAYAAMGLVSAFGLKRRIRK